MPYSARTDYNIANTPDPPPVMGPANSTVVDPDFGTTIVRATDANTLHNASFSAGSAGGSLLFNVNSTLFWINTVGGGNLVLAFNPSTMTIGASLIIPPGALVWSHVNPLVLYTVSKGVLIQYTLAADLSSYSSQTVFDFTTVLGPVTWNSEFMVSQDDSVFGVGFSILGGQGTGQFGCAYVRGRGMRYINTLTGQVAGQWGPTGAINIPDQFQLHEVSMGRLGDYIILGKSVGTTKAGDPNGSVYFWDMLALDVQYIGDTGTAPGGHPAQGYRYWMNPGVPFGGADLRLYTDVATYKIVVEPAPGLKTPLDGHASWHNGDTLDTAPFCQIMTNAPTAPGPYPSAWVNEIILMDPVTGLTYREGHTFASGQSPYFSAQYAIGGISPDGRFVLLCSDWMGTLGLDQAGKPRADIFIYQLH